tara:strand:+ start:39023 stop:40351 length:1329 start_codon:yes stop_codon:yes gene_type:complete
VITYYCAINEIAEIYALMLIVMVIFQFSSFENSIYILSLALLIPFFDTTPILGSEKLTLERIAFFPFLLQLSNKIQIRKFNMNKKNSFNFLISAVILVAFFSILQIIFDINQYEYFTPFRLLGFIIDIIIVLFFFYGVFGKMNNKSIDKVFDMFLFILILEGISILLLIIYNPNYLYSTLGPEVRVYSIERNLYFGTRNVWGILFSLIFVITFIRFQMRKRKNIDLLNILMMIISLTITVVSLSRRAYFLCLIGIGIAFLMQRNFKPIIFAGLIALVIFLLPTDFLYLRVESMLLARSFEDLRYASSGTISYEATEQFLNNITIIPNALSGRTYERNLSESLWSGILYRQGVLGLLFQFIVLFLIYRKYNAKLTIRANDLQVHVVLMKLIIIIFFIMGFITSGCYFINFIGYIQQIGIITLFLFFYSELMIFKYENNKLSYL